MKKNDKNIDIFDHDCNENHEKLQKMTKTLTFLIMIAAKIMKHYETCKKIQKMTTNDKNIDIFEYDCSENNEQL